MSRPGAGCGPAVARPIVGHPADAEPVGGREEGLGRGPDVRRAVVPEDYGTAVGIFRAGVVDVQSTAVSQLKISLRHTAAL